MVLLNVVSMNILYIHMQKKSEPHFTLCKKVNLKWTKDLDLRPEIVKQLEKNIEENLHIQMCSTLNYYSCNLSGFSRSAVSSMIPSNHKCL